MMRINEVERRLSALLNPRLNRRAASRGAVTLAGVFAAVALLPIAALQGPAQVQATRGGTIAGVVRDQQHACVSRTEVRAGLWAGLHARAGGER